MRYDVRAVDIAWVIRDPSHTHPDSHTSPTMEARTKKHFGRLMRQSASDSHKGKSWCRSWIVRFFFLAFLDAFNDIAAESVRASLFTAAHTCNSIRIKAVSKISCFVSGLWCDSRPQTSRAINGKCFSFISDSEKEINARLRWTYLLLVIAWTIKCNISRWSNASSCRTVYVSCVHRHRLLMGSISLRIVHEHAHTMAYRFHSRI